MDFEKLKAMFLDNPHERSIVITDTQFNMLYQQLMNMTLALADSERDRNNLQSICDDQAIQIRQLKRTIENAG